MNVYDFDKTICKDDTESDFFFYELRHHIRNLFRIPYFTIIHTKYKMHKITREEYRNGFYKCMKDAKDIKEEVNRFWIKRQKKMLPWYLKQQKEDDVIISATPRFLLEDFLTSINIKNLIASDFDLKERKCIGKLVYGEEKVIRFCSAYDSSKIDAFYSDSMSDLPMFNLAKKAYKLDKKYNISQFK